MGLKLTFYGAAGEVTGSRHLLEAGQDRILLDCGYFQGHRREAIGKNKQMPFDPPHLNAVLLSHAHIDHTGSLPLLVKNGFKSPIHCTEPTLDLCSVMLMDSAHIQEEDAKYFNKIHSKDKQSIEPLYTQVDIPPCLDLFKPHRYEEDVAVSPQISARFHNAGHVLGSSMVHVAVGAGAGVRRILYTGDLGRRESLLETPPQVPANVDYLIIESTYGARMHDPAETTEAKLAEAVNRAVQEKGKLIIPSFALERTQEVVFVLEKLARKNAIPKIPIYVDSPTAVDLTEIYRRYADFARKNGSFNQDVLKERAPFGFGEVHYVHSVEESKSLNELPGPLIIISASGMCEAGRILHHLGNNLDKGNATVLIVGYQADGTLGRRLLDGAKTVKIFGVEQAVKARVEAIHSFSAHADQGDILWFIKSLSPRPRMIFLVHGDPEDRQTLVEKLKAEGIDRVACPNFAQSYELS